MRTSNMRLPHVGQAGRIGECIAASRPPQDLRCESAIAVAESKPAISRPSTM
jgi:hypothetical protein